VKPKKRQRLRAALLLVSLLLFPVTIYYFSPYLCVVGAAGGIVAGSTLVFTVLFFLSVPFGRLFCGWICPAGALQEFAARVEPRPVGRKRIGWIKYAIWLPWILCIGALLLSHRRMLRVDFFYQTDRGISVARPEAYAVYLSVVAIFLAVPLLLGRRGACHAICWMAPFMVAGRKLSRFLHIPSLTLPTDPSACTSCGRCTGSCPMSLHVAKLAGKGMVDHAECVLCGTCADACPHGVIRYGFKKKITDAESGLPDTAPPVSCGTARREAQRCVDARQDRK